MKKSAVLILALILLASLTACAKAPASGSGTSSGTTSGGSGGSTAEPAGADQNTIPWNGVFNGTELPAPDGRTAVSEYTVKDDSVTIRIEGFTWEEFQAYCAKLEALPGWQADEDENTSKFPADYNSRQKTYCTGEYQNLPHISLQYYSDEYAREKGLPNFVMFVFTEW